MHNLHLVTCNAESPEDACALVETHILDFGNENNWRTICGCVSEKNEVYINDKDGRYPPDEDSNTIEKINKKVNKWVKSSYYGEPAKKKIARAKKKIDLSKWNSQELFSLERLAKELSEALPYKKKEFNVLTDEYYAYQYNECGATQMNNEDDGDTKWVVFVDMHD